MEKDIKPFDKRIDKELKPFLAKAKKTYEVKELERLGLAPEIEQWEMIMTYFTLIYKWNSDYGIIPKADEATVFNKHFCDSLQPLLLFGFKKGATVFDIGAGGGFPSIPIIIFRPDLTFTLSESNRKLVSFLKEVKEKLNLENMEIVAKKCEKIEDPEKAYDYIISRNVGSMEKLSQLGKRFVTPEGRIYLFEPEDLMGELTTITENKKALGVEISEIAQYNLSPRDPEINLVSLALV